MNTLIRLHITQLEQGWGPRFYLTFRQLSPVQDSSLISLWFMICRSDGSTFFTMFSSWWGSDVRLYTSTNACRRSQGKFTEVQLKVWSTTWLTCAHLVVCELAVLQVCILQSSDAGVCVVEGVFAYAVWEAFLEEIKQHLVLQEIRRGWWEKASCHRRSMYASTRNLS